MPVLRETPISAIVERPLDIVHGLFDKSNANGELDGDWGVTQYFKESIHCDRIPLLTPATYDQIPTNSLCRFQGMVQDMLDPEYYLGASKQPNGFWRTTKFSDHFDEEVGPETETAIWERKPFYCCRVPGQSAWRDPAAAFDKLNGRKIQNDATRENAAKRGREEGCNQTEREDAGTNKAARGNSDPPSPVSGAESAVPVTVAPQDGDCMVIVYEAGDSLKLNDVVEFIGIMSRVPELAAMQLGAIEDQAAGLSLQEEGIAARPPTSLVPRIHVLAYTKLLGSEELPLILFKGNKQRQEQVAELRKAAVSFMQTALGGDKLAAEYILLQLVSRVQNVRKSRRPGEAVGKLMLGLTNCPLEADISRGSSSSTDLGSSQQLSKLGKMVVAMLGTLVPRAMGLPLEISKLNSRVWVPARDLKAGRLTRAPLQLADNTHLVLDETLLKPGQLSAIGLRNLGVLKDLLEKQTVEYDFNVYGLPIMADVPVLVLSEHKSLLHDSLDVTLPLNCPSPIGTVEQVTAAGNTDSMGCVRAYLALMRFTDFTVPQTMTGFLEKELAAAHGNDVKKMHSWMTLARVVALSYGDDELSEERWAQMRALEHAREQRLRVSK